MLLSFQVVKSHANRYAVRFDVDKKCRWRVHANNLSTIKSQNWWKIKTYGGYHIYLNAAINSNHRQAMSKFVCSKILFLIKSETKYDCMNSS